MSSSAPPKMSSRNRETKRKITADDAQKKTDDRIMNTNDSSIVSKRCVSRMYFPEEPDFYEPFVGKYVRRNPLINRGYWQRMHAIEQVVRRFLEEDNGKEKVVINLGCGYDPLPFQFWHRHASISENCTFVDVDYPQLIERKRDRMMTNNLLRKALLKTNLRPSEGNVYLRSDKYIALGCNLKFPEVLESDLRNELDLPSSSILFVAEVSVTYMPTSLADSIIRWASKFENARFCLLEQHLPNGANHPFAKTMLAHFNKLHSPIHAVHQYPLLSQQSSRFTDAGWSAIDICRNLWDLWSDNDFTPPQLRRTLDWVEPFDEWEEFALYAGHYFLLVASNTKSERPASTAALGKPTPDTGDMKLCSTLTAYGPSENFPLILRRFGAAFSMDQDVAFHGGQGLNQRLTSMDILHREDSKPNVEPIEPFSVPQARVCHTITSISDTQALLVGGRTSPSQALADCWTNKSGDWQQVEELTPARFRHSSTKVKFPLKDSEIEGVLVFGGKTSDGVLEDWCIWTPDVGWRKVPVAGSRPLARFGAAISTMGVTQQNWGLLCGGMDGSGTVLDDIWQWKIYAASAGDLQLTFVDRTNDIQNTTLKVVQGRIGASLIPFGQSLLLIGGVSKKEILPLAEDFLTISRGSGTSLQIAKANITVPESAYPLLVGFSVAAISADEIIIAGGGAVCFAMGSFWNEGFFSIRIGDIPEPQPWSVAIHNPELTAQVPSSKQPTADKAKGKTKNRSKVKGGKKQSKTQHVVKPSINTVSRLKLQSSDDFTHVSSASNPMVLEGLDLGPCTSLWTLDYLKEKIGPDRELIVHECCSDQMTSSSGNFQSVEKSVIDFLSSITAGAKIYLSAVPATQPNTLPTKLDENFPTIAADFQLPDILASIKENHHSSPLSISGPVSLRLHYDVLATVICQVRGTRNLQLYPPSDAKYLDFPPGDSSSNIDVLASTDPKLRHTHPHIASIAPGDVLFIPPLWAHTTTRPEGVSVAININFRNLGEGLAVDKDMYGGKDLRAYETGRRDVEKILKAFENLPVEMSKFYLDRLIGELQDKADKRG